ncbi:hypothetical protein [Gilvimarinus xylanilyticus]|uniref:Uncharacterized protein n=1 Tax=Gilvimarinus xylanilyticus TaxID=2944139 RepID=A0A9X2I4X4_9GAMM|nr:hypothetical protein [Gilvimarinus xylanilyticus]MCP8900066.1 hypothetical protein [Gilvimarinus xylanilyticus]
MKNSIKSVLKFVSAGVAVLLASMAQALPPASDFTNYAGCEWRLVGGYGGSTYGGMAFIPVGEREYSQLQIWATANGGYLVDLRP